MLPLLQKEKHLGIQMENHWEMHLQIQRDSLKVILTVKNWENHWEMQTDLQKDFLKQTEKETDFQMDLLKLILKVIHLLKLMDYLKDLLRVIRLQIPKEIPKVMLNKMEKTHQLILQILPHTNLMYLFFYTQV
jgi:hypothetical protein